VVDGKEYEDKARALVPADAENVEVLVLPYNTGHPDFFGHRIFAAMGHLIPDSFDYVFFLDADNKYKTNHVQGCLDLINKSNLDFVYATRDYISFDGKFVLEDNCDSLGEWRVWPDHDLDFFHSNLVDTSTYCFSRDFIEKTAHLWHGKVGADRIYFNQIKNFAAYACTKLRTVSYRIHRMLPEEYNYTVHLLNEANKLAVEKYGTPLPWEA
jgi:hypothetical protein